MILNFFTKNILLVLLANFLVFGFAMGSVTFLLTYYIVIGIINVRLHDIEFNEFNMDSYLFNILAWPTSAHKELTDKITKVISNVTNVFKD